MKATLLLLTLALLALGFGPCRQKPDPNYRFCVIVVEDGQKREVCSR